MFKWLIKKYYKIPFVRWRNPVRLEKRDDREYEWRLERKKYGFDERVLWNLGSYLHDIICKFLKLEHSVTSEMNYKMPFEEFNKWFEEDLNGVKWIEKRLEVYIKWECPTFYWDKANMQNFPQERQSEIVNNMLTSLKARIAGNPVSEEDIKFLHKHIFHLGW